MGTNDHHNINPLGTDRFKVKKCFHHSKHHSAKSLLCDTVYYNVYSKISSNISCLRIEHFMQMRILKYCQSRAVSGILANL